MSDKIHIEQNHDHIGGNFKWEIEPTCKCGKIKDATEEKFVFVSNFTNRGFNQFYMMPVTADGYLFRDDGVQISHCPWCGDEIKGNKEIPIQVKQRALAGCSNYAFEVTCAKNRSGTSTSR